MSTSRTKPIDLQALADTAQELLQLVAELTRLPRSRLHCGALLRKADQHMKLATNYLRKIDLGASASEASPVLSGSIHDMISRQIDSMAKDLTMAAARPIEPMQALPVGRARGFHGHAECLGLVELVDCLGLQRKDGVLEVRCPGETVSLWFEQGDVVHATSNHNPPNRRLGDILVDDGVIERDQLDGFLFRHASSELRVGDLLVKEGLVTLEQLRKALAVQVRDIFQRLQNTHSAEYSFYDGLPGDFAEQIRLSVTYLLLESARRADESGTGEE